MPEAEPSPSDACRSVEVDGEAILIRGSGDFTEQERGFAAEIVRAAKRKYAAEHPDTEVILTAPRRSLADDAEQLVAEARAAIARARALADRWDNALAPDKPYARDLRDALGTTEPPLSPYYSHEVCGFHWHGRDGLDIPVRDGQPVCPRCELARVVALYEQWVKAGPPPLGASMARWWDARLVELHTALLPQPADQTKEQ